MRHRGGVSGGLIEERVPPAGVLTPSTSANMTVGMQKFAEASSLRAFRSL